MSIKIFYAWQSDRDEDICHYLIRDAANDAIERLRAEAKADAEFDEAPALSDVVLDHDTKGVPGSPKIADIIQKKIRECDVFLADVTNVAEYQTDDRRKKKTPNANVSIELGQALGQKPPERILLVMNTTYGSFKDLPFDLALHRRPIRYTVRKEDNAEQRLEARHDLADKLYEAFKLMAEDIASKEHVAKSQSTAAAMAKRRGDAERFRETFEEKVTSGQFKPFVPDRLTLATVLVPLVPPAQPVDVARHELLVRTMMSPFKVSQSDYQFFQDRLVTHNVTGQDASGGRTSSSTSAIYLDGTITIAAVLKGERVQAGNGATDALEFSDVERGLIIKTMNHISLLRTIGMPGPWLFGISLLRIKGTYLHGARSLGDTDGGRLMDEQHLRLSTIDIPDNIEASRENLTQLSLAMRQAFDPLWRAAGYARDPYINSKGEWI